VLLSVVLYLAGAVGVGAQQVTVSTLGWVPGPGGVGDTTISGAVDQPSSTTANVLTGWVVDTTAQGWSGIDDVQIFNGLMDGGGHLVAHPVFQLNRPDVASSLNNAYWAASGWSASIPNGATGVGAVLYVYAHTPAKGWWYQQAILNVPFAGSQPAPRLDVELPTPLATVHDKSPYTMRGSAYDPLAGPGQGTGVDRVQVYLNGDRQSGIYIGDAQPGVFDNFAARAGPQFANAGWQLTFQTSSWLDTQTDNSLVPMTVYARSSLTDEEAKVSTTIVISLP
jgi:hypothetical protein